MLTEDCRSRTPESTSESMANIPLRASRFPHAAVFEFCLLHVGVQRFRQLALDKRMWLVVSSTTNPTLSTSTRSNPNPNPSAASKVVAHPSKNVFPNLQSAVGASRPGDTIWLAPDQVHQVKDVVVAWPLHILGGGGVADDTLLVCPKGADTGLDFRYAAQLMTWHVYTVSTVYSVPEVNVWRACWGMNPLH